jgi:hypothetical protein
MSIRIPVQDSAPSVAFEDAVHFALDLLGGVPEFRSTRGRQIELHGTLALIVLAAMAGHTRYRDVEAWGKLREDALAPLLGLVRMPSDTTIGRIIKGVDAEALRKILRSSAAMILADKRRLVTAKDGKVMRAARIQDSRSAHMVSVVEHNTGVIMDVDYCKLGEGELTASRRLDTTVAAGNATIVLETTDALYTNAVDAKRAVAKGGHYLTKIKKTRLNSSKTSSCASLRTSPS